MKNTVVGALSIAILALPAAAWAAPTPTELMSRTIDAQGTVTFWGKRVQLLTRQHLNLRAEMKVFVQDGKNYRVTVQAPDTLAGVHLWMKENKANVYFPMESLLFRNDNPTGSNEAATTIFSQLSQPQLLSRNYDLKILEGSDELNDIVALTPCYILDATPKRGYSVPGHRFWISRDTYQVLKEERTWNSGSPPYFTSFYEDYIPTKQVDVDVRDLPQKLSTVALQKDQDNSFVEYRSVEAAEAAIKSKVPLPKYVPAGFQLHGIQFANFFGTRITQLHYTDGLNWMFVSYRPKPNMFLTLMAGAFALSLIDKMGALSYQAPYNYAGSERNGQLLYSYGDLYPDDLNRVLASIALPQVN
jgi:outer membrane lipoprotein-sorting protein